MLIGYTPKLGATVKLIPSVMYDKNDKTEKKPMPGKIVYINSKHRYFIAEFNFPGGSFWEGFKFVEEGDLACRVKLRL